MIEYVPTRAPYSLVRATPHQRWTTHFEDRLHAMWELMHSTEFGVSAELRDADGRFIASAGPSAAHPQS